MSLCKSYYYYLYGDIYLVYKAYDKSSSICKFSMKQIDELIDNGDCQNSNKKRMETDAISLPDGAYLELSDFVQILTGVRSNHECKKHKIFSPNVH